MGLFTVCRGGGGGRCPSVIRFGNDSVLMEIHSLLRQSSDVSAECDALRLEVNARFCVVSL